MVALSRYNIFNPLAEKQTEKQRETDDKERRIRLFEEVGVLNENPEE